LYRFKRSDENTTVTDEKAMQNPASVGGTWEGRGHADNRTQNKAATAGTHLDVQPRVEHSSRHRDADEVITQREKQVEAYPSTCGACQVDGSHKVKKAVLHEDNRSRRNGDFRAGVNGHPNIGCSLPRTIQRNHRKGVVILWPEQKQIGLLGGVGSQNTKAGESLTPSPIISTTSPAACSSRMMFIFCEGSNLETMLFSEMPT
jgi:hypothetical protein